jgi:predicted acyltransferase
MILVNNPGTWSAVYPPLLHAEWDGWTYTDTIFPFFLFIAGVAMALSLGRRRAAGAPPGALARHLAVRAAAIVGLGLALGLASFFAFHKEHMRFPGVLQRIGVCVLIAGALATAAGLAWGRVLPVNKSLWTSSYALLMSGLACVSLAACVWIVDVRRWKRWAAPLVWLGRNAIAAFTLSTLGAIALIAIKVAGPEGKPRSLWTSIYRTVFDRFADPRLGSLLFALAYLALWLAVFGILYRRRIFIRI